MAYALVTGASGGIGREFAKVLSENGYDLVLVARNKTALEKLAEELKTRTLIIPCNLSQEEEVDSLYSQITEKEITISVLINNAGFGDNSPFLDSEWNRQEEMVKLNLLALMRLSYLFGNEMKKMGEGHIVNLSSVAAFSAGPDMSVYYASKAFVLSFSESLSEELRGTGVTVTALCPGPTSTGFEKSAGMKNSRMFSLFPQTPEKVAKAGCKAMIRGRSICYHGPVTHGYNLLSRILPRTVARKIAHRVNGGR